MSPFYRALAIGLAIAIFPIPEFSFYTYLRVAVFSVAIIAGIHVLWRKRQREDVNLVLCLLVVAALFNPFDPVQARKWSWMIVDAATAYLFWQIADRVSNGDSWLDKIPEYKRDAAVYLVLGIFFSAFPLFAKNAYPVLLVGLG